MTDEHVLFLNQLNQSKKCDMFEAAPYIQKKFKVNSDMARLILMEWKDYSWGRKV